MHDKRVALVTGANQGIGLQIAKELASKGLTVLVGARDLGRGEQAAQKIAGDARAIQLDVTDAASIAAAARQIRASFGRLDVLVNNAAISRTTETFTEHVTTNLPSLVPIDTVRAVWETNVFGVLAVHQAMLPLLREAPHARIVNVSSVVGSLTLATSPENSWRSHFDATYAASKTALNAMTVAMAIELEGTSIKVNAVSPGFTKTNLNDYQGTETVEEGAAEAVRVALLGPDAPSGTFTHGKMGELPW